MPPRHHYWTIILEGQPTAFRAHVQEELLPTLRQLQARHPDAVMKWFARGRLWESQDQERADAMAHRRPKAAASGERRPRDWRPGGEHKDPRERFKIPRDEKRRRFAENLRRDRRDEQGQTARPQRPEWRGPSDRGARPPEFRRPPRTDRPPQGDRQGPPWRRDDRKAREERPWKRDRPPDRDRPAHRDRPPDRDRSPGTPPRDRRSSPGKPGTSPRPPSRRPPARGGRPPGQGGRFGPGPPSGRKPGGGKGGGGRGSGGRGR